MAENGRVGYRDIADELRQRIDSGELAPGSRVPGENDLMSRYDVERPTARQALEVLKNEGLIVARRGSGTFVREFKPIRRVSPNRLRAGQSIWDADLGSRPRTENVTVDVEQPSSKVAEALDLGDGDRVVVRRRRYVVEDKPVQLATSYFPESLVAGTAITRIDTGSGGVYARLAELGAEPTRFTEELPRPHAARVRARSSRPRPGHADHPDHAHRPHCGRPPRRDQRDGSRLRLLPAGIPLLLERLTCVL
ncbi:GntR family transcriptional regulator [Lentzea chajnantorensis]